jgi:NADPH:quinone reductase-like Zn-dependent oxidoreductase
MKAIRILEHGGVEQLRMVDLPDPQPAPGEVRVRVSHVALNHLDVWVRRGVPGHSFGLPRIPGSDVAVQHEGKDWVLQPSWGCGLCNSCQSGRQDLCKKFKIRGESTDGGCASLLCVAPWMLLPVPKQLSPAEAASLPLTLLTAWHMLVGRAQLQRGERVLVQAGGSGVGVMAIQIARLFGCDVHATSADEGRRRRIAELGATPHPYEDIPKNFDVVVETVGKDSWEASCRALTWGGRLVCCGATSGPEVGLNLRLLFFKQLTLLGSTMGSPAELRAAWREVEAGTIRPVVDRVLPMSRIGEAHGLLERRELFGKVVLEQDLE